MASTSTATPSGSELALIAALVCLPLKPKTAVINSEALPLLIGAREAAKTGVSTGGAARNREWLEEHLTFASSVSPELQEVCFDPQTSGGLIIAVPEDKVVDFEQICTEDSQDYFLKLLKRLLQRH